MKKKWGIEGWIKFSIFLLCGGMALAAGGVWNGGGGSKGKNADLETVPDLDAVINSPAIPGDTDTESLADLEKVIESEKRKPSRAGAPYAKSYPVPETVSEPRARDTLREVREVRELEESTPVKTPLRSTAGKGAVPDLEEISIPNEAKPGSNTSSEADIPLVELLEEGEKKAVAPPVVTPSRPAVVRAASPSPTPSPKKVIPSIKTVSPHPTG